MPCKVQNPTFTGFSNMLTIEIDRVITIDGWIGATPLATPMKKPLEEFAHLQRVTIIY